MTSSECPGQAAMVAALRQFHNVATRLKSGKSYESVTPHATVNYAKLLKLAQMARNVSMRGAQYTRSPRFQHRFADRERTFQDAPWRRQDSRSARSRQPSPPNRDWWSRGRWSSWRSEEPGRTSSYRRQRWV